MTTKYSGHNLDPCGTPLSMTCVVLNGYLTSILYIVFTCSISQGESRSLYKTNLPFSLPLVKATGASSPARRRTGLTPPSLSLPPSPPRAGYWGELPSPEEGRTDPFPLPPPRFPPRFPAIR